LSRFSRETSPAVGCVAEHAEGVHITLLIAGLGEHVLWSKVVQGGIGVKGATTVLHTKRKGYLEGGILVLFNDIV